MKTNQNHQPTKKSTNYGIHLGIPHKRALRSTFSCNIWFWSSNMCFWSSKANMSSFMDIFSCCSLAIFSDFSSELAWWVDGKVKTCHVLLAQCYVNLSHGQSTWSPQKVADRAAQPRNNKGNLDESTWKLQVRLRFESMKVTTTFQGPNTVLFWNSSSAHPSNLKKSRHVFYILRESISKNRFNEVYQSSCRNSTKRSGGIWWHCCQRSVGMPKLNHWTPLKDARIWGSQILIVQLQWCSAQ